MMAFSRFLPGHSASPGKIHICSTKDVIGGALDAAVIMKRDFDQRPHHWLVSLQAVSAILKSPACIELAIDDEVAERQLLGLDAKDQGDLPSDGSFILVGERGATVRVVPVLFPESLQQAA